MSFLRVFPALLVTADLVHLFCVTNRGNYKSKGRKETKQASLPAACQS